MSNNQNKLTNQWCSTLIQPIIRPLHDISSMWTSRVDMEPFVCRFSCTSKTQDSENQYYTHTHRGKHSYKPGEPYLSTSCIPLHSKTASMWGRNGCQLFHMWLCWWCNPQWQPPLHPHPPMPSPTLPMLEPNACYTHKQNFPSVVK
jgi:hypothetical protein